MISIIASANRPHLWKKAYDSYTKNLIDFEVIFVGDVRPNFDLPENFHYIHSDSCPALCYNTAIYNAKGEASLLTADDAEFSNNMLDILYMKWKELGDDYMIGPRTIENGKDITSIHRFLPDIKSSPIMIPFIFVKTSFLQETGVDCRFRGGQWENDVTAIWYSQGGKTKVIDECYVKVSHKEAHNDNAGNSGIRKHYPHDRAFLLSMWTENGQMLKERKESIKPFEGRQCARWM